MKKIGIISDTHSYWDDRFAQYFADCDEIWHAGDIGNDPGVSCRVGQCRRSDAAPSLQGDGNF